MPKRLPFLPKSLSKVAGVLLLAGLLLFTAQYIFFTGTLPDHNGIVPNEQNEMLASKSGEKSDNQNGPAQNDVQEKLFPPPATQTVYTESEKSAGFYGTELEHSFKKVMPYFNGMQAANCLHGIEKVIPKAILELGLIVIDPEIAVCLSKKHSDQGGGPVNSPGRGVLSPPAPSEYGSKNGGLRSFVRVGVSSDVFNEAVHFLLTGDGIEMIDSNEGNVYLNLKLATHDLLLTKIIQPKEPGTDFWIYPEANILTLNLPTLAVLQPLLSRVIAFKGGGLYAPFDGSFYAWQLARGRYLTCNKTLAENFKKQTLPPEIIEMEQNATYKPGASSASYEQWIEATALLRDMMYQIRVPAMLSMGTLLGWYRNCDWISYTTDVDIAFFADDFTPEIERILRDNQAFKLLYAFGLPWESYEITVKYKNSHNTDLFAYYNEGNMTWVGTTLNTHPADLPKFRWYLPFINSTLCTGAFHNHLFFVPCEIEPIMSSHYGENWYEPSVTHGSAKHYQFNGFWPNSTRHLTERKHYIVCWNGGTERLGAG